MELFRIKKDIPFMSYGRLTTTISLITFIIAIIFLSIRGLNLGVDFTGGTLMEVSYSHPADIDKIRQVMDTIDLKDTTVQNFGTSKDVLIRLPIRQDLSIAQLSEKVSRALIESDKDTKIQRVESVGSQVGEELYANGALALLLVCFGIIVGFFAFFQWEFNLTVLAAILAVLGYSVNESVVVFDRVRENFKKMRKASVVEVIDNAITRTMSRTVITHLMTQTMVCSRLFFGGETLHNFSLALTIGILFGIYSSVLVACPVAMWLGVSQRNLSQDQPKENQSQEINP